MLVLTTLSQFMIYHKYHVQAHLYINMEDNINIAILHEL
jgi:hypothetical protein